MADERVQLGYRELAERLGISPDAARMKAKRAVKSGRWRIIPGNHPSDRVLVELPTTDLNAPARASEGTKPNAPDGEQKGGTGGNALSAQVIEVLQAAYNRIHEVTGQLMAEKDRHKQTAIELAQAETREMGLGEEIHRLESRVKALELELLRGRLALREDQRTWWQRMTGRS